MGEVVQWRRRVRVASMSAIVAGIAVAGLMLTSHQESSAATPASVAAAPAAAGAHSMPSPTAGGMPADMPGMDMSGSTPSPTTAGDMPADMPGMDMPGSTHQHGGPVPAANRPLAPVLGTFGAGTGAVLLAAAVLRRKDRALDLAKRATRPDRGSGR